MKLSYLLLLLSTWSFFPQLYPADEPQYRVYVFLSEQCVISQSYALELRELHTEFAGAEIAFIGVFSNPASHPQKMATFKEAYQFPFEFIHDRQQTIKDQFGVAYTPEVVVFDTKEEAVLYQGRIDNTFYRVGRRRRVTTTSELADALTAIREKEPICTTSTPTVGCVITPAGDWIKSAPMCQPLPE